METQVMIAENITSTIGAVRESQSPSVVGRVNKILTRELSFVPNRGFISEQQYDAGRGCQRVDQVEDGETSPKVQLRPGLPPHLLRLCEASIMTAEEEQAAFRRMNFLKYYYNHHRMSMDSAETNADHLDMMEDLLVRADRIRNDIVSSSIRLVISIVKKYCTPHCVFDDLLSDGIVSLLRAVDKFDFDRGFRFSTYATQIIHRDLWRAIARDQKSRARFNTGNKLFLEGQTDETDSRVGEQNSGGVLRVIDQLLDGLDERERMIITGRFGLETSGRKETFVALGKKLGISKERVRQLAERAVAKLRTSAQELGIEEEQLIA